MAGALPYRLSITNFARPGLVLREFLPEAKEAGASLGEE
jgi:hypothetical protein